MLCFYGDDFTGAAANLAAFQQAGLAAILFLDTPCHDKLARHPVDVVGIAGISRSLRASAIPAEITPPLRLFKELGAPLVQYKICSTFDSSPDVGSFGAVLQTAAAYFGKATVPVVAACPSIERFTVFGNHFAPFRQSLYRLDRHPIMSRHPATPMLESDLCLHLERQVGTKIGLVDINAIKRGPEALKAAFEATRECPAAIFDSLDASDLDRIAELIVDLSANRTVFMLAAQGLAASLGKQLSPHSGGVRHRAIAPVDRLLVLSGSASLQTEIQIRRALSAGWQAHRLDVRKLLSSEAESNNYGREMAATVSRQMAEGHSVVVYTALGPDDPALLETKALLEGANLPVDHLIGMLGDFYGSLASTLIDRLSLRRIALAGGDSSSQVMRRMKAYALDIAGTHPQGCSISRLYADDPKIAGMEVLLKAGQIGGDDVFLHTKSGEGWQ